MRPSRVSIAVAVALVSVAGPGLALADTYTEATFSGAINPGNANVQPPFAGNGFTQGDTFTGTFVFDNQSVPGGGSDFVNVGFPGVATIPAATEFSFDLDGLTLNFSNEVAGDAPPLIQYNNGQFNGFVYNADFAFMGSEYQFEIQGTSFVVQKLDVNGNPILGTNYISGLINDGNSSLTGKTYTPPSPVPLPPSVGLLISGVAGLLLLRRRRSDAATPLAV
jgi:hypothetical protein